MTFFISKTDEIDSSMASTIFFVLLVPGVGAQGGSLQEVCRYGMNKDCGLLVNSSRGIIYASDDKNFAEMAAIKAKELQEEMALELEKIK